MFKFFKNLQDGSSGFLSTRLFDIFDFRHLRMSKKDYFENKLVLFPGFFKMVGVSKFKNNGFGASVAFPIGLKIMEMKTFLTYGECNLKATNPK